ncbi:hypothetical protein [Nostoc sp. UHCC 0252]|uniref:hypothetical protein n=1 Tax=Nostoc sp. UHCC 0252 TaxID=3110241 RepID=UPI002B1E9DBB|nr:hypothetical protein [Nostoc sp. UHCC 0252]MEA5606143.1 hypothetical protein [Nostoc sp. UHCC 0252]
MTLSEWWILNRISTHIGESAIAKSRRSGFLLMDVDNYPKIISISLQLRLGTANQH